VACAMRELHGSRGVLRERDDGCVVMEVLLARADAAEALALPLGAPLKIWVAQAKPVEPVPTTSAPVQTISTDGQESLALGHGTPLRPADMQRMQAIQRLLQMPTFQAFAWERSGLQELPPDAVAHTAEWLFGQCGAKSPADLLEGVAAARADDLIKAFRAENSIGR